MDTLQLSGVSENNLKNLSLTIAHDQLTVITGLSGSGKSTLAFDTIYAEGGRRYIETFSPYTRQFLDRLHAPALVSANGIRPALALEQRNRITSSRSTVGTITEINDYLKVVWSHFAELHCEVCNSEIRREPSEFVVDELLRVLPSESAQSLLLCFELHLQGTATLESLKTTLLREGHLRYLNESKEIERLENLDTYPSTGILELVVDRIPLPSGALADEKVCTQLRSRLRSSVAQGYQFGRGKLVAYYRSSTSPALTRRAFSDSFHCSTCDTSYPAPRPSLFSFNSPLGACPTCHGFGKVLAINPALCVPDRTRSLKDNAIACWATDATRTLKAKMLRACEEAGISLQTPWRDLSTETQQQIFEGIPKTSFKGVLAWFARLEQKKHRMHVRVLLSRYRQEVPCSACLGTRLQVSALRYRVRGLTLPELWQLPIDRAILHLEPLRALASGKQGVEPAVVELLSRLRYLCDIGLPYLTLDRQSRTLSGGESQRVNLTSLLGSQLVHTLLVLDEPTIGLHPKDTARLIHSLTQLRDRNNSLIVVEHDPDVMRAADHIIDLGPGAGSNGGEIVAEGTAIEVIENADSRTGRYLARSQVAATPKGKQTTEGKKPSSTRRIEIVNAHGHNLKNISVHIPLDSFVCITGASGSGKSTLVHHCLHQAYIQLQGGTRAEELMELPSVPVDALRGLEHIDELIVIDQSPIGKSPRSNPATYTKAWDYIRDELAATDAAQRLGLGKSAFSFNVDGGRCPNCKGAGSQKVEMQFLADVYVTCETCNGSRFQDSVLSVRLAGRNVIELLETTIDECIQLADQLPDSTAGAKLRSALAPLHALGLGYLRLGHPLSALSGGEAQRVKLASFLRENQRRRCLFILDEPTTGLHPDNIADLLHTFSALITRGHSVLCIEHNLDVIAQADWIIDLGPDGGEAGGRILAEGNPQQLIKDAKHRDASSTLSHLWHYFNPTPVSNTSSAAVDVDRARRARKTRTIEIKGAREHNLKNVSLSIPEGKLVAITGVSGSGKSTLAFDILFAEGQRRYINCLSPYARQYIKQLAAAEVDQVLNVPPTIAVSQKSAPPQGVSTLATTTEIYQYLRLLYAKAGTQYCIKDKLPIASKTPADIVEHILDEYAKKRILLYAPVVSGRKGYYNDLFQRALRADIAEAIIDGKPVKLNSELRLERHKLHWISLAVASLTVGPRAKDMLENAVSQALVLGNGVVELYEGDIWSSPKILSIDRVCPVCSQGFRELDPQDFSFRSARGVCDTCGGRGQVPVKRDSRTTKICPDCEGARIGPLGRHVYFAGKRIHELTQMNASQLRSFLEDVAREHATHPVIRPLLRELLAKLTTIEAIGLDYLSLNRDAATLSGGEAQRLRLAKTLGTPLSGVCYVLDEPSIGLHTHDHAQLLRTLELLRDQGNTVLVVEHDEDTIRAADYVIDIGPGGGAAGGMLVHAGSVESLEQSEVSKTGLALRARGQIQHLQSQPIEAHTPLLKLYGAQANNLRSIDVSFPLGKFIAVCGVSGAGKSSLVHSTLIPAVVELLEGEQERELYYDKTWNSLKGGESLTRFLEIDQSPVGKTSSSAPISYLGIFDDIRKIYAQLPEAKARGWAASHFSFNTGAGRCPHCEGKGEITIPMSFMPDATTLCEHCEGMRYTDETLEVEFFGVSIGRLLKSTFDEAAELFQNHRLLQRRFQYVRELGLGYLTLGQPTHTLSGGEAQRIKIARELGSREAVDTLYVLDEPTIGLHMTDVDKLRDVLQKLVDCGNTVVVIEHNLDIIRSADYVIEIGPGPGERGGELVFAGTPEEMVKLRKPTLTGQYLLPNGMQARPANAKG